MLILFPIFLLGSIAFQTSHSLNVKRASYRVSRSLDPNQTNGTYNTNSSVPIPPSQDPFYTAPDDFKSAAPGTILRVRSAPGDLTSKISNCSAAYNILYRTTDSLYEPSWAVTTLFVPITTGTDSPLLSYQIPYDSANVDQSPSYTIYDNESPAGGSSAPDIIEALSRGWYVNMPDYEGPLAAFAAGVQPGHATLDSVRAALSSEHGPRSCSRYAMWGFSGGALASEWAAELQKNYAPELKFSGAALGGLTPNVTRVIETVEGGIFAMLTVEGIVGFTAQYPDARDFIVSQLKETGPSNKTEFLSVTKTTYVLAIQEFMFRKIADFFQDGFAILTNPRFMNVLNRDGIMGHHGVPQMPIFAHKSIADEISPIEDTDALVEKYCGNGVNILYTRNSVGGHSAGFINGRPEALSWLQSVLDGSWEGTYGGKGCITQNLAVNISSSPY